jgi:hypothetical protein
VEQACWVSWGRDGGERRETKEAVVDNEDRVTGWWVFAGILLLIAGTLNIIWGIAAIAESQFFTATGAHYVFSSLKTWGWVTLILGSLIVLAGFSLFAGGSFGRWFGIFAAGLTAIVSLLDIRVLPFWSICVFALSVIVIYELAKGPETEAAQTSERPAMSEAHGVR